MLARTDRRRPVRPAPPAGPVPRIGGCGWRFWVSLITRTRPNLLRISNVFSSGLATETLLTTTTRLRPVPRRLLVNAGVPADRAGPVGCHEELHRGSIRAGLNHATTARNGATRDGRMTVQMTLFGRGAIRTRSLPKRATGGPDMSITPDEVKAAVHAAPTAAPLPDAEIERLAQILNQHRSDPNASEAADDSAAPQCSPPTADRLP